MLQKDTCNDFLNAVGFQKKGGRQKAKLWIRRMITQACRGSLELWNNVRENILKMEQLLVVNKRFKFKSMTIIFYSIICIFRKNCPPFELDAFLVNFHNTFGHELIFNTLHTFIHDFLIVDFMLTNQFTKILSKQK
jgi:hypothetical protein